MVAPCDLTQPVPPGPRLSIGLLNAARGPFRVPPSPHSMAMLVSWSGRTLIGKVAMINGPWVNPRHGRRPWYQVTALDKSGTAVQGISSFCIELLKIINSNVLLVVPIIREKVSLYSM